MAEQRLVAFELLAPTRLPPPCYDLVRADAVYGEAFRRAIEFVSYQRIAGPILEFGVLNGYTAHMLAKLAKEYGFDADMWLFDSFDGLPSASSEVDSQSPEAKAELWREGWPAERIPGVKSAIQQTLSSVLGDTKKVHLIEGWFSDTRNYIPNEPASIVHLDCDLYESTRTILQELIDRKLFQQGQILLFDDWNCGRASRHFGQRRAVWNTELNSTKHIASLEAWFSYGWHGQTFIIHV